MAVDFSNFTTGTTIPTNANFVGYDVNASGGEKKWTLSTVANAVSGVILPQFAQTPAITSTFKNKLINGNFDIWQRGTSLTSAAGARYLADRWTNGSTTTTYTAQSAVFTLGQTDVPNEPKHFHRTVVTSGNAVGCNATLHQHIEDVRTFAGKTVTLSFYAKTTTAPESVAIEFYQNFGTGGSPSSPVSIPAGKFALTTSWQKFTVTASIPSIAGKTIGTGGNDCLTVYFWMDAGSNFSARSSSLGYQSGTFDIAQVQLEEGSIATPFEQRPIGTELSLCERYYETTEVVCQNTNTLSQNFWGNGSVTHISLKQTKRAYPVLTTYPYNGYPFTNTYPNNSTVNYIFKAINSTPLNYSNITASGNVSIAVINNNLIRAHGESALVLQPAGSYIQFFLYIDAEL